MTFNHLNAFPATVMYIVILSRERNKACVQEVIQAVLQTAVM